VTRNFERQRRESLVTAATRNNHCDEIGVLISP